METGQHLRHIAKAVGKYERAVKQQGNHAAKSAPKLITLSRQIGAGGRSIAEKLAEKLGCMVWGREILDVLASQTGGDYRARMFHFLDESTQGAIDELVSDFFGQAGRHTYHYLLPKAVLTIAQSDAVFLGRGANLLLPQAFHVRITASIEHRITAFMAREHLRREEAEAQVRQSDHKRDAFMKEFAHTLQAKQPQNQFDILINTDRFTVDAAAAVILQGFELFRINQQA